MRGPELLSIQFCFSGIVLTIIVRTDDEIRELCIRASLAQGETFAAAITELKIALRDRIEDISNFTLSTMLHMPRPTAARKKDGTDG